MKELKAIIQPFMLDKVLFALKSVAGVPGITVSEVKGWGKQHLDSDGSDEVVGPESFAPKIKLELVVPDELLDTVRDAIAEAASTGHFGDGKIFTYEVADTVKIRTGERGPAAI